MFWCGCNDMKNALQKTLYVYMYTLYVLVDNQFGEDQITFVEHWIIVFMGNSLIHQRMRTNEIQYVVRQLGGVLHTSTWPWFGHLWFQYRQPCGIRWCLLFEFSCGIKDIYVYNILYYCMNDTVDDKICYNHFSIAIIMIVIIEWLLSLWLWRSRKNHKSQNGAHRTQDTWKKETR